MVRAHIVAYKGQGLPDRGSIDSALRLRNEASARGRRKDAGGLYIPTVELRRRLTPSDVVSWSVDADSTCPGGMPPQVQVRKSGDE